jgi:hypothetical protein
LKTDITQRQDVAMLFLKLPITDYNIELYWGLWLFLAILVYKSRFLPRFLGVWLINGFAYLILSFTGILLRNKNTVFNIALPAFFGELVFMLWLLIMGARPKPLIDTAPAVG